MSMSIRMIFSGIFVTTICLRGTAWSQQNDNAPVQSAQNIALGNSNELNWAQKMFEHQKIDFGTIAKGSDARFLLKVTNLYKEDVHISNVKTTCGCSAATPAKTTLTSLESTTIEITMDTQRFSHRKDSNVIINFDLPFPAEVRIPITSYIRTDVVMTPGAANFGAIDKGAGGTMKVQLSYAGRDDWKITDIVNRNEFVTVDAVEIGREPGKVNYELQFTVSPETPVGKLRGQITIVTNDAAGQTVPLLVEAKVESDITVTPEIVNLGMLIPGQAKTVNVVLRSKKPFAITKIECESDRQAFQVRLPDPEKPKAVYILPLTVTPPSDAGNFTEDFTITVDGRPEPVQFKAFGKIVPGNVAQQTN